LQEAGSKGQVAGGPDSPPAAGAESEGQQVNRLTKTFTDRVPLSNFPAVAGVVRKAVRTQQYTEAQIVEALDRLADEGRSVTTDTLRYELEGKPATTSSRNDQGDRVLRDAMARARATQHPSALEIGA
jgi:hypothetical protein